MPNCILCILEGCPEHDLFETADLYEAQDMRHVRRCLVAMSHVPRGGAAARPAAATLKPPPLITKATVVQANLPSEPAAAPTSAISTTPIGTPSIPLEQGAPPILSPAAVDDMAAVAMVEAKQEVLNTTAEKTAGGGVREAAERAGWESLEAAEVWGQETREAAFSAEAKAETLGREMREAAETVGRETREAAETAGREMRVAREAAETQEAKDVSTMLFKVAVESLKEAAERDAAFKLVC